MLGIIKQTLDITVKSGMLTDNVEYIPNALFNALSQAQDNALPDTVADCAKRPSLVGTLTNDQISIETHAIGTMIPFATKSQRIF